MTEGKNFPLPRIALVGCGAIAESLYLPTLTKYLNYSSQLVLVDVSMPRVKKLASEFGVEKFVSDYRKVIGDVDGAIVALPHRLHAKVSVDFLRGGVHVLCEKPLSDSFADAQKMVKESQMSKKKLLVGNFKRLYPGFIKVKEMLGENVIGDIRYFYAEEGSQFNWPTISGFFFKDSYGGVLGDTGAHTIDTFCWWFGSRPKVVSYNDDSFGGNEALCTLDLKFGKNIFGFIKLSRFKEMCNKYLIQGNKGTLVCDLSDPNSGLIILEKDGRRVETTIPMDYRNLKELGGAVTSNFVSVVRGESEPFVEGKDVLHSISVIDECYRNRKRFVMPWVTLEDENLNVSK